MRWKPLSTNSTRILLNQLDLASLITIAISHFLWVGKQNEGKGAQIPYGHAAIPKRPTPAKSRPTPPPTYPPPR